MMVPFTLALCTTLLAMLTHVAADLPSLAQVYYQCSANSTNPANLDAFLARLVELSASLPYTNASATANAGIGVYGVFQCRGDINHSDCASCVSAAAAAVKRQCPDTGGARVMLDSCFLRYESSPAFYSSSTPGLTPRVPICNFTRNNTNPAFQGSVAEALVNVSVSAPLVSPGFATFASLGVYALAQCFGYLSSTNCHICVSNTQDVVRGCPNAIGGQAHYESCYYRYDSSPFFFVVATPSPSPLPSLGNEISKKFSKKGMVIAGVVVAFVLVLLGSIFLYIFKLRKYRQSHPPDSDETLNSFPGLAVQFSYTQLKEATGNFSEENKIGEGGFGPVYKGMLENGVEVAIKKMSSTSRQGKKEFINEVDAITSVQHLNLIRLLGYCMEGTEKLLVYEYHPNKSLDNYIFDPPMELLLDWNSRFMIILGIARGLAYLHHDSQVRIIHRDIKPNNILLANDFTPKIADFGLAKLMADDTSHVSNTRLAGTFGYMAPEYAMRGHLSDKVDVFSFGLVALEVVTGRRNIDLQQPPNKQRLLEWAWGAFREGRQMELVDKRLEDNFSGEEAIRAVHIALLCTQSLPRLRPTMFEAIQLLVGQSELLNTPMEPPFINTNLAISSYLPPLPTSSSQSQLDSDYSYDSSIFSLNGGR